MGERRLRMVSRTSLFAGAVIVAGLVALASISPANAASEREPLPVVRQWHGLQVADSNQRAVEPALLWTVASVVGVSLVAGSLYLLKRRVGAFPSNPDWVAPISVMPAGENASEEADYPAAPAGPH